MQSSKNKTANKFTADSVESKIFNFSFIKMYRRKFHVLYINEIILYFM